ncbi:DEAD/DEAH box helicase [Chitinophaga barathri]|uniref:DEAD-box ATP-dependent RNA helicase RhpA n=1 Tax=Chitinophaga barathri TaxID=1647451 RepID=A0A3N4MB07_9BACT|nr:DEAD/DEAH box helicase [Chitinophaga barathri]RPD40565.1 DEAD/DEAH box helicase [Chitinophaga barathri]
MSFEKLSLIAPILRALETQGYTTPTPIQSQAIPVVLAQKDLLACAQTGTGKTAAFAIPILQLLYQEKQAAATPDRHIKTLILTPTRELAIQIAENIRDYGAHTGIKHLVIFGGVSAHTQIQTLKQGTDILIATPGRLLDLWQQGHINLRYIRQFVLDEADRMLDMGFIHDVKRVITKLPEKRQTLFFSATTPNEIAGLANSILTNPEKVAVTPVSSTAEKIEQQMYYVDKSSKRSLLIHVLKDASIASALVFTRTKHGADRVAKELSKAGIQANAIHGDKSQNSRQRALTDFKAGRIRVLVATDIAARGIDVDNLSHVINYEIPNVPETYVHRIGRTGRGGASGIALSFCEAEERPYVKDITKLIGQSIPVVSNHPFPAGESAERPAPAVQMRQSSSQQINGRKNGNGGNGNGGNKRKWHGGGGQGRPQQRQQN